MIIINSDNYFYVCNGEILKNQEDLVQCLEKIDKNTFSAHVNKEKNDFANWIKDIFNNKELGNKIKKLKTSKSIAKAVSENLKKEKAKEKKATTFSKDKKKIISQIKGAIKNG